MSRFKDGENPVAAFFKRLYISYIPNRRDNFKQVAVKLLFIAALIMLIVSAVYLTNYFSEAEKQKKIIDNSRDVWHQAVSSEAEGDDLSAMDKIKQQLLAENSDFKGWITIDGTQVDNPIYQTDNNDFYLNHNQKKQYSTYGALFFDSGDVIDEFRTDKNLVVYGHRMKNGSMFGTLKKFKSLSFYKKHPTIDFSTLYGTSVYKIYAVFILNAVRADDNDYIYDIYRQDFESEEEFAAWRDEAYSRSIINTGVDVEPEDNILTLITCTGDFENARLVIMAREARATEADEVDTSLASVNPNPVYPQKWYDERGISK